MYGNTDEYYYRELNDESEIKIEVKIDNLENRCKITRFICITLLVSIAFMIPCWWNANTVKNWVTNPDIQQVYTGEYGYNVGNGVIAMDQDALIEIRDTFNDRLTFWSVAILFCVVILIIVFFFHRSYADKLEGEKLRLISKRANKSNIKRVN